MVVAINSNITAETGFPAIADEHSQILILGSMPSVKSLQQQQYYAHPRNAFWPIMCKLFDMEKDWDYQQRSAYLIKNKVAVWDVLKSCQRQGSLDQDINKKSIITNDFNSFLGQHPNIQRLFFNGTKAEQVFKQHVLPTLNKQIVQIPKQRLPSTSPAHAAMKFEQKLELWKQLVPVIL